MPHAAAARAFRNLLLRSVIMPVVLMGILAAVLIWQIGRLVQSARYVERIDQVIARVYLLEKLHVDMETGMRGYLLRGQDEMLQAYNEARPQLEPTYAEVLDSLNDLPKTRTQIADMRPGSLTWMNYAAAQIERRRSGGDWVTPVDELVGKKQMDAIRARFHEALEEITTLRTTRNADTARSAFITMSGAGALTLGIGLLIAAISRGQLRWLATTHENALVELRQLSVDLEKRVEARTRELAAANGQLHEANKELEAFAYSVSHDLRAPMRHITGFADLLRMSVGPKLGADDLENLDTIHRTALLAGRMVDDLLAFSRVGRTKLRTGQVDMNALVKSCRDSIAPDAAKRPIDWQIEDLRPTVGDAALLKMAFQNLLANAVKYTGTREQPRIEIGSRPEGDGSTYWVRDNGVGFDMAYAHKLFGVFQRLHRAEEFEGTGIGLANVRRIILRHGGQVWAEGLPNAGAAFYIHLPDQPKEPAPGEDET